MVPRPEDLLATRRPAALCRRPGRSSCETCCPSSPARKKSRLPTKCLGSPGGGPGLPSWGLTTSECKFQTSLHDPGWNRTDAGNFAEVSIAHRVIGIGKARRVESIEHLPAELETVALVQVPVLCDHRIHGLDGRALEHILAAVAKGTNGVIGERCGIKILIQPLRLAALSDVQGLAGNDVGAISELQRAGVVIPLAAANPERKARLEGNDPTNLPAP